MCNNMENKNTLWEFIKCQIRTKTIAYSKALSKPNREKENVYRKTRKFRGVTGGE